MEELSVRKLDKQLYRQGFKIKVIENYVSSQDSISCQSRKLGIDHKSLRYILHQELAKSGYYRILDSMNKRRKENPTEKDLQKENEELRKALELATLKVAGLETLIEVAESEMKINIRKKLGAKQSK